VNNLHLLTMTELRIAQFAANGFNNDEIAQLSGTVSTTVKVHLRSIFKKLAIRRRHDILRFVPPQREYSIPAPQGTYLRTFLDHLIDGHTDTEIAVIQKTTVSVVHQTVTHLRLFTGLKNRNQLAMWWMQIRGVVRRNPQPMTDEEIKLIEQNSTKPAVMVEPEMAE
jgi:DNA-binding CsgD family transcriptional regulator